MSPGGLVGGGGGSRWRKLGGTCPQGQALVNHRLPLSPCPPSNHTITLTRTEYWDRAGGEGTSPSRHFVTLDGPKWLTMGSKRAQFTCLCTPNGEVIILEKHVFDQFLTLFDAKKPIFKAFRNSGAS